MNIPFSKWAKVSLNNGQDGNTIYVYIYIYIQHVQITYIVTRSRHPLSTQKAAFQKKSRCPKRSPGSTHPVFGQKSPPPRLLATGRRGGEYWNSFHAKLVILYAPRSALKTKMMFLLKESGGEFLFQLRLSFLVFFLWGEFLPRCSVKRIKKKGLI